MESLFGGNRLPVEGKTVLITGASQGLGLSAARILSSQGASIIIVARNQEKLSKAIQDIEAAAKTPSAQRFHTISADLTSPEETARLFSEATKWNNGSAPDIVWANAGAAIPKFFLDTDIATMRSQMDTNYWTALYLARETLSAWLTKSPKVSRGSKTVRHLIMTSSIGGIVGGLPGYAPYSPTKAALRSLHDSLRAEMDYYNAAHQAQRARGLDAPADIDVHCVMPGTILTPGLDEENKTKPPVLCKLEESDQPQTPDDAAAGAIKGLQAGRGIVPTQGLIGEAILGLGQCGSFRDRPALDLLWAWIAAIVWLFVGWDMRNTSRKFGAQAGPPEHST